MSIDVTILGSVGMTIDGATVPFGDRRQRLFFAVLAHDLGVVQKSRLMNCLWNDKEMPRDPQDVVHTHARGVRSALRKVRPEDGDRLLRTVRGDGYELMLKPDQVDRHRFARFKAEAEATERRGPGTAARAAGRALREWKYATGIRGGNPLVDCRIEGLTSSLQQDYRAMVLLRIGAEMRCGRHERMLPELTRLSADEYGAEDTDLARLHMIALFRAGRPHEALRIFERYETALDETLSVQPPKEMKALAYKIGNDDDELKLAEEDYAEYGEDEAVEPAPEGPASVPEPTPGKFSIHQSGEKARAYQAESMVFHEKSDEE